MKSEVTFDCLLLSHDPAVLSTMDRILQGLSIRTDVCPNTSIAANLLTDGGTDLIVIDLESERSMELIHKICESSMRQKPTILAVSKTDRAIPGVHIVLRKPVTPETGAKSLQTAYSRMLRDYRKPRIALQKRFHDPRKQFVDPYWTMISGVISHASDRVGHDNRCILSLRIETGWIEEITDDRYSHVPGRVSDAFDRHAFSVRISKSRRDFWHT